MKYFFLHPRWQIKSSGYILPVAEKWAWNPGNKCVSVCHCPHQQVLWLLGPGSLVIDWCYLLPKKREGNKSKSIWWIEQAIHCIWKEKDATDTTELTFNLSPSVWVSFCLSDPAKSTRLSREDRMLTTSLFFSMDSTVIVKTACDLEDSLFMEVDATRRFLQPLVNT